MSLLSRLMAEDAERLSMTKIKAFKGMPIAECDDAKLFMEFTEVAGFKFLKFQLFSPVDINTFKGCQVVFKATNGRVALDSDTMEIVTFFSEHLKMGFAEFDIDLPENLEALITNDQLISITVIYKKEVIELNVTNQLHLQSLIQ